MTASTRTPENVLAHWCERLRSVVDENQEATVEAADQLAVENAVALGVSVLAGEDTPAPRQELPQRPILAKDLLLTADLVRRALIQYR